MVLTLHTLSLFATVVLWLLQPSCCCGGCDLARGKEASAVQVCHQQLSTDGDPFWPRKKTKANERLSRWSDAVQSCEGAEEPKGDRRGEARTAGGGAKAGLPSSSVADDREPGGNSAMHAAPALQQMVRTAQSGSFDASVCPTIWRDSNEASAGRPTQLRMDK